MMTTGSPNLEENSIPPTVERLAIAPVVTQLRPGRRPQTAMEQGPPPQEPALIELAAAAPPAAPQQGPNKDHLRAVREAALVGTIEGIARVLSPRFVFLLAAIGAFALALLARDWLGVAVFVGYCALVMLPLVALDYLNRRKGG